jgi:hypothetical protein
MIISIGIALDLDNDMVYYSTNKPFSKYRFDVQSWKNPFFRVCLHPEGDCSLYRLTRQMLFIWMLINLFEYIPSVIGNINAMTG